MFCCHCEDEDELVEGQYLHPGEPYRRTPRVHQIVVDAFFVMLDGLTYFFVWYFQHVLCIVDDKRASLHENQVAVLSDFASS